METSNKNKNFISYKNYIKNLANSEISIKSISFSISEDNEFIIYFTWKQNEYNQYYVERDNFRKLVKSYLINRGFCFNAKSSTSTKYIFINNKKDKEEND